MLFVVTPEKDAVNSISSTSFKSLNIWERKHLESWLSQSTEFFGEELLVLTTEFDRFKETKDRLDILAIDKAANLVVIELKRDEHASYADLQALRYAAMVSTFTLEKLVPYYQAYINKHLQKQVSQDEAYEQIYSFLEEGNAVTLTNKPRIILVSQNFSAEITTTVLWLRQFNVDLSCIRVVPHLLNKDIILNVEKIIPLKEEHHYFVQILEKEQEEKQLSKRNERTQEILLANKLIHEGDRVFLKAHLLGYVLYDENDMTFQGTLTANIGKHKGIIWSKDGLEYSLSELTTRIFYDLDPEKRVGRKYNGYWFWTNAQGIDLVTLSERYR